jgi:hypothetical protein
MVVSSFRYRCHHVNVQVGLPSVRTANRVKQCYLLRLACRLVMIYGKTDPGELLLVAPNVLVSSSSFFF